MRHLFSNITGNLSMLAIWFASLIIGNYAASVVHVLSLEDTIYFEKHVGVFKEFQKRRTVFRRR